MCVINVSFRARGSLTGPKSSCKLATLCTTTLYSLHMVFYVIDYSFKTLEKAILWQLKCLLSVSHLWDWANSQVIKSMDYSCRWPRLDSRMHVRYSQPPVTIVWWSDPLFCPLHVLTCMYTVYINSHKQARRLQTHTTYIHTQHKSSKNTKEFKSQ